MSEGQIMQSLRTQIVAEDERLEAQRERSARELMQHRWHWTTDESNPQRVSVEAYAAWRGKAPSAIRKDVEAFVLLQQHEPAGMKADEARERARRPVNQDAAIKAVAEEYGQTYGWVRRGHSGNKERVQAVLDIAQRRSEEHGTPIEEEAARAAKEEHAREVARKQEEEWKRQRYSAGYVILEARLDRALDELRAMAREAAGMDLPPEWRRDLLRRLELLPQVEEAVRVALSGEDEPEATPLRIVREG